MPPVHSLPPKSPIIDTSILFDFLVWRLPVEFQDQILAQSRAAARSRHGTPEAVLEDIRSRPLDNLGWYLAEAKPIQTPSQVVAEVQGLAKSKLWLKGARLESFWRLARQEFDQIELLDECVKLTEMDRADFMRYGPADASIMTLAGRLDAVVLASDARLRTRCEERHIKVLGYAEVISLWRNFSPSSPEIGRTG